MYDNFEPYHQAISSGINPLFLIVISEWISLANNFKNHFGWRKQLITPTLTISSLNIHTSSKYLTCPESTFYHAGRREERESIEVHLAILPSISNFHDIFAKVRLFFKNDQLLLVRPYLVMDQSFFFGSLQRNIFTKFGLYYGGFERLDVCSMCKNVISSSKFLSSNNHQPKYNSLSSCNSVHFSSASSAWSKTPNLNSWLELFFFSFDHLHYAHYNYKQ